MKRDTVKFQRIRRKIRTRASVVSGNNSRPRVSVYASLTGMYVQIIDDKTGRTLVAGRDHKLAGTKTERAVALGNELAKTAVEKGIKEVVFDRGSKRYHGRLKALAESLRAGGLVF